MRHCPAEELNFLAVLMKMMSSSSGLMSRSMRMRMLTAWGRAYARSCC
jgi:hypothetical protein